MELPDSLRNTGINLLPSFYFVFSSFRCDRKRLSPLCCSAAAPTTVSPSEAELRSFTHEQLVQYILQSRSAPSGASSCAPEQSGRKREREGEGAAEEGADATAEAQVDGGDEEEPVKKKAKAKKVRRAATPHVLSGVVHGRCSD